MYDKKFVGFYCNKSVHSYLLLLKTLQHIENFARSSICAVFAVSHENNPYDTVSRLFRANWVDADVTATKAYAWQCTVGTLLSWKCVFSVVRNYAKYKHIHQWLNTLRPRQNGYHYYLRRRHFQVHLQEWKLLDFKGNFTELCSLWSNWQYGSIGSDTGLVPN